eukprot:gene2957-3225_t
MNPISYKLSMHLSRDDSIFGDGRGGEQKFVDKLEALEAALVTAKDEIRFRTPTAPVIGLNGANQSKYASVGLSKPVPTGGLNMEIEPDYDEEGSEDDMIAYAVLEDSSTSSVT